MPKSSKRFIISTSGINTQGFRMLTEGAVLNEFKVNPLMLFNHQRPDGNSTDQILPIGNWVDLKVEGDNITATPNFDDDDDFAMKIYKKVENGFLVMCSAGAEPMVLSDDPALMLPDQKLPTVTKWKLKEASICDIGANPDSLAIALYDVNFKRVNLSDFNTLKTKKVATKKPTKAEVEAARKLIKLADEDKPASDPPADDDKDKGNDDDQDPTLLSDDDKNDLIGKQKKQLKELTEKLAEMEKAQTLADQKAEQAKCASLADNAIAMRKITLAQRDLYIRLASADYEGTEQLLNGMKPNLSVKAQMGGGGGGEPSAEDKKLIALKDKTFDELFRDGTLQYLKDKAPDIYILKYKEKFGKDPK